MSIGPLELDSPIFIYHLGSPISPIKTGSHPGPFPQPHSPFLISYQHLPILPHKYLQDVFSPIHL